MRCINLFFVISSLASFLFLQLNTAYAEIREYTGTGEYIMEDNETLKHAQDVAYDEAMRSISQQVAVYVRTDSRMEDMQVTEDEVELMATALVKVKEKEFTKEVMSDGKLKVRAFVIGDLDEEIAEKILNEKVSLLKTQRNYDKAVMEHEKKKNEREAMQKEYNEVVRHTVPALMEEGGRLRKEGKFAEAIEIYNEIVKRHPQYAKGYVRRGEVYLDMGEHDAAKIDFNRAIEIDEKEAEAYFGTARMLEKTGRKKEAIAEYRKVIEYANIVEHGELITEALDRIAKLDG